MKVLITAPSLKEDENVSGISTLVRNMIERRPSEFVHFEAGRKDGEAADAGWMLKQAALPFRFFAKIVLEKPAVVHINTAFIPLAIVRDASLVAAARVLQKPVFLHIHGGPFVMEKIGNSALEATARALLKIVDAAVVFSDRERAALLNNFPGTRVFVLPNGIPLENIPETVRSGGEKTIIFFGRLHVSKGTDHIVESCRVLAEQSFKFKYICYGAGPELESFATRMTAILGDKFSYRGVAKGDEKWRAFAAADIFFQPSRDEGLPLALLEAMAAGCVPVMSESGAVGDVIEDGHNGFLVHAGDTIEAVGRLKVLLSEGEIAWNELRNNARRTIREKFSFEKYLQGLDAIYDEIK